MSTAITPGIETDIKPVPQEQPEKMSIQSFYLSERNRLNIAAASVDAQLKEWKEHLEFLAGQLQGRIQHELNELNLRFGQKFQQAVNDDLKQQGGTKKSISYVVGEAGYRKGRSGIVVKDEAKAIADAEMNHPQLVKSTLRKREMKTLYDQKKELLAGTEWKEGDNEFFPSIDGKEIAPEFRPKLEGQ